MAYHDYTVFWYLLEYKINAQQECFIMDKIKFGKRMFYNDDAINYVYVSYDACSFC